MEHNFQRRKDISWLPGSSLRKEMPDITDAHMEKAFGRGAGLKSHGRKSKDSPAVIIHDKKTGHAYSVYKRYGEWRIGGYGKNAEKHLPPFYTRAMPRGVFPASEHVDDLHKHILSAGAPASDQKVKPHIKLKVSEDINEEKWYPKEHHFKKLDDVMNDVNYEAAGHAILKKHYPHLKHQQRQAAIDEWKRQVKKAIQLNKRDDAIEGKR